MNGFRFPINFIICSKKLPKMTYEKELECQKLVTNLKGLKFLPIYVHKTKMPTGTFDKKAKA